IVLIMLIFGLNMAGLFEIGASAIGAGSGLTAKSGLGGSFFSGLFATVVATPCTAPLLANALPFALSLPAAGSLAMFTVIGLGLSRPRDKGLTWEKWSPQLVQELRAARKPVYVDFTARWCATCQVNHRVYDAPEIIAAIKQRGIALLKADWTSYDPVISQTI